VLHNDKLEFVGQSFSSISGRRLVNREAGKEGTMFCPKCAAQNVDGASFCRVCGANISLVSQALAGRFPEDPKAVAESGYQGHGKRRKRNHEPPTLEGGIVNLFAGIGFLVAALVVMYKFPGGIYWGWSFFIPAFDRLGRGIAALVAQRKQAALALPPAGANTYVPPQLSNAPQPMLTGSAVRNTGEMVPTPPSVTEGTTRHLGAEAPTRHLDSQSDYQK
jgi:hypothetical protein